MPKSYKLINLLNQIIEADLTWTGNRFESGVQLHINSYGQIAKIASDLTLNPIRLKDQVLLPGFINVHSHIFQRELRNKASNKEDLIKEKDFWTWRQEMYNLALSFNEESFYNVAKSSFLDMQAAGITTLGEFHYLHHENPLDSPDSKPFNFDKIILKAANDTNMRIVLLLTYYEQGGVGVNKKELESAQKRFETPNFEDFWKNFDNLQMDIINEGRKMQSLGVCAHSIRGVGLENIGLLRQEAEKRGVPFHMHLEEQPQEIQDCLEVFGKTPSQLLLNDLKDNIADNMTLIHCTHTKNEDLKLWVKKKANICVCPLTEGNLGDGVFPFLEEEDGEMNVSLGSDCNFRLCFFEEMRWLLYCQQMRNGKRGLSKNLVNSEKIFPLLLKYATVNGAKALGLQQKCGILAEGYCADFFTIDLSDPYFLNFNHETLAENLILGTSVEGYISSTCINGYLREYRPNLFDINKDLFIKKEGVIELDGSSLENFLVSMMKIPSTTGSESPFAESLSLFLEQKGWKVHKQHIPNSSRFNIYAHHYELISPKILFNSHLDTVPPYIDPIIEDEIIKGRGSCDAKGQIACQIFAIEELLSKLPELANKLAVLYVVGEEVDHIGMLEANKLFLNPEFLICGEPTELKLAKRQKGILKLKLTSKGKSAHSGYPQKGHNALEPLLDVLQDLKSEKWLENNILGKTTMNIGVIKAGEASNVVPGYAEALISFRLVTEPEIILEKVEEIIKGRVLIEKLTSNSPLSLEVLDGMDRDIVAFNTDIAYFNGFKNGSCKALLFGVGSITDAHSDWEFVRKEDLKECVKSYKKIILELVSKLK